MRSFLIKVLVVGIFMLYAESGFAQAPKAGMGAGLAGGAQKPLEVKGQTRSMTLFMANPHDKDKLAFVKARHDFRDKIKKTSY